MNPRNEVERLRAQIVELEAERDRWKRKAAIGAAFEAISAEYVAMRWVRPVFHDEVRQRAAAGAPVSGDPTDCRANRDGDCDWHGCPQIADDEPSATGRHCPLDVSGDPPRPMKPVPPVLADCGWTYDPYTDQFVAPVSGDPT